jgi:hypothetical protein
LEQVAADRIFRQNTEVVMPLLFRTVAIASAFALSTAAFAGNQEGNKPFNNIAVTASPMYAPQNYAPENRPVVEGRAAAEQRVRHHRKAHHPYGESGGAGGMVNSQSAY